MDEHLGTELPRNRTLWWVVGLLTLLLVVPCVDVVGGAVAETGSRAVLAWLGAAAAIGVLLALPLALLRFAWRHHVWVSPTTVTQDLGARRRTLRLDEIERVQVRRRVTRPGMGPYGNRTLVMSGPAGAIRVSTFFVRDLGPLLAALDEEARRRPALRVGTDDTQLLDEMVAIARSR